MKIRHFIFAVITSVLLFACQGNTHQKPAENNQPEESPMYEEVMAIHDAVMPEISTLHSLKKSLNEVRTETNQAEIRFQIGRIERADEAMMSWMASFEVPEDSEEADIYLLNQKKEIQLVADSMNIVIKDVQELLKTIQSR